MGCIIYTVNDMFFYSRIYTETMKGVVDSVFHTAPLPYICYAVCIIIFFFEWGILYLYSKKDIYKESFKYL